MTFFLKFDGDGRCVGREFRTPDQLAGFDAANHVELAAESWNSHRDVINWWRDGAEIKRRAKVPPPTVPRQRMHAQPLLSWTLTETPTPGAGTWKPRAIFRANESILVNDKIYTCQRKGITGDVIPLFTGNVVFEPMPWVEWTVEPTAGASAPWLSATIYMTGELIRAGGRVWRCAQSGVTRVFEPDWKGDVVADRDYVEISPPDLGGGRIILNIGDERIEPDGPLRLMRKTSGRFLVSIDSPGVYSDPVLISVENP